MKKRTKLFRLLFHIFLLINPIISYSKFDENEIFDQFNENEIEPPPPAVASIDDNILFFAIFAIVIGFYFLSRFNSQNNTNQKRFPTKIFPFFLLLSFVLTTKNLQAQVQNNGVLFIKDNSSMHLSSGTFTFGSGSTTQTSRTADTYGILELGSTATFIGASFSLFADGFVSTKSNSYFVLPTGQGSTYAPIGVSNASVTYGVTAAYFEGILTSSTFNSTITTLPTSGYWVVKGDNASIKLLWSSDISSLTNSIANLTVAGLNNTNSTWEAIASATPSGDLIEGSIESSGAINLSNYSAFTLAKRGITCAPLVVASQSTRTWNGSAWDVVPTLADAAVLTANYPSTAGSFVCNSLSIGTNTITLNDGQTIEVVNDVTGTGIINLTSTASILQRNDASTITPTLVLTKSSRADMYANDYIYWGSPLTTDSFSQLNGARAYDATNTLVGTAAAFDVKYQYVSGITGATGGWQNLTQTSPGKGFIMRIKEQAPYNASTSYDGHINLTYSGLANNGTITIGTTNIVETPTSARNNNLLANPYPSAIDADKFLEYNTNLDGAIYLWKAQTPNTGEIGLVYTIADYIAYTRAGSTGYTGTGSTSFNGKIATGQGFKVRAINPSGTGNVTFNNCMRVAGNNDQFMRLNPNSEEVTIDRYKLKMTDANGVGNQILVAYLPETTLGYDRMYDAKLNSVSSAQMYSILEGTNTKLAINARPAFQNTDVVALGISKSTTPSDSFSITIADKEGVFAENTVEVFLHDIQLNTYHNLANGPYTFTTNTSQLNDRFQVVYQNGLLSNPDFNLNGVIATLNKQTLSITSNLPIAQVDIFDMMGRLVMANKISNSRNSFVAPFNKAEGVYIVKIKLDNGLVVTQKLINY
jgi:hypothetical protein